MSLSVRRFVRALPVIFLPLVLSACVSDGLIKSTDLAEEAAYETGFHDGRHSGLQAADELSPALIKDLDRYTEDKSYRQGWNAGEEEGLRIRKQLASLRQEKRVEASKPQPQKRAIPDISKPQEEVLDTNPLQPRDASSIKF
ncbi:hypothetical protein [Marinobacterium lutimaris]|uniref:Lipoprotein n=1 Tax=Marinobacterium lutimaris TaxID=568106 RepID=A0A1H5Z0K2_9GAMM|nr:hypothetical protein [Marinobacterium lutimaris]SEG30073.1 hypothetical protein SAMN05444390_1011976 [Marinobacterium lutimaris]